ncbi:TPA: hypothetical protein N0F65_012868 [Lagenidium giganteum]|uniref:Bacteriophage/plasmid primase P4 C-terminal domain-containing protein n=1 Tax=Lagenidium giganteum TaxID=4803 RepID=A0AAV2YHX9_9STRA|nr:TPA: hypothetical protein N0F65_012868 [Lagenidium giganteum]
MCDRKHDNDNTLLISINKRKLIATWRCAKADTALKSKLFYKRESSASVDGQKKSQLDLLKEEIFDIVSDKYKREFGTGVIYEKQLDYYYTRKYDDPKVFINEIFYNNKCYHSCTKKTFEDLLYFIKNMAHPDFEFIKLDYDYIGFKNGVYELSTAKYIPTEALSKNIQVRKYIDQEFEIRETPYLDGYLRYQFEEDDIDFIYFMIGRLLTKLTDRFDFMVMLYGEGGSGKSLLMKLVKFAFVDSQVGILSDTFQDKFGLFEFVPKQMVSCDDMPYNMAKTLPRSDFLSMMTLKGKGSIEVQDWDIPSLWNSNHFPNYTDKTCEIVRRVMTINFEKTVSKADKNTNLESDIIDNEYATFLHRCRSKYFEYCDKYSGKDIEMFCPQIFIENRDILRGDINNSYQFAKEQLTYAENEIFSKSDLTKAYKAYIKERFGPKQAAKETLNAHNVELADERFKYVEENICRSCRKQHIAGCCPDYERTNKSKRRYFKNIRIIPLAVTANYYKKVIIRVYFSQGENFLQPYVFCDALGPFRDH